MTDSYLLECARIFQSYSRWENAQHVYAEILKKNVRSPEALLGLGICLYRKQNWKAARSCFTAYGQLSGNKEFVLWVGSCYVKSGDKTQARQAFVETLGDALSIRKMMSSAKDIPQDVIDSLTGLF
jgi:uncharacterized protein HemY